MPPAEVGVLDNAFAEGRTHQVLQGQEDRKKSLRNAPTMVNVRTRTLTMVGTA